MIVAAIGMVLLTIGVLCQVMQLVVSIRHREQLRDRTGDPLGRTFAGMGDLVAAASVQLCLLSGRAGEGMPIGSWKAKAAGYSSSRTKRLNIRTSRCPGIRRPVSSAPSLPPSWGSR